MALEPPQRLNGESFDKGKPKMSAELFRTISTCLAALFVSTMLVTAATSTPIPF